MKDIKIIRGHNLDLFIRERDITAQELKPVLGISSSSISAIRTGRQLLSDDRIELLCQSYDVDKAYFDEDRTDSLVKKTKKQKSKDPASEITGKLTFEADGFRMELETRSASGDDAEVTRLALRIIEIRSR